jgi:large subunit ribosomal protein L35
MPRKQKTPGKHKTRKAVIKRFKITGSGKVMMRSQNIRHLQRHKSKRQKRQAKLMKEVKGKFAKKIKQMLGI